MNEALNVEAVVPLARGGTLAEYVDCLRRRGQFAVASADGRGAWVRVAGRCLARIPYHLEAPPSEDEVNRLLRFPRVCLVTYTQAPAADAPANCFNYLCRTADYGLATLRSEPRRKVRRALNSLTVRLCTWRELAEHGYAAYLDTEVRHHYRRPSRTAYLDRMDEFRDCPLLAFWGAWDGDRLVAWDVVLRADDWAIGLLAGSANDALPQAPNNGVYFAITRTMMSTCGCSVVSMGLSALQEGVESLNLHRFKLAMGYEPVPMRRVFVFHPLVRPLFRPPAMARLWKRLARAFPGSGVLGKLAGLSRNVSGQDAGTLDWARPQHADTDA